MSIHSVKSTVGDARLGIGAGGGGGPGGNSESEHLVVLPKLFACKVDNKVKNVKFHVLFKIKLETIVLSQVLLVKQKRVLKEAMNWKSQHDK